MQATAYGRYLEIRIGTQVVLNYTDNAVDYLQFGTVGFYAHYDSSTVYDNLLVESVTVWSDSPQIRAALNRLGVSSIEGVELGSWAMIGTVGAPLGKVPVVSDIEVRTAIGAVCSPGVFVVGCVGGMGVAVACRRHPSTVSDRCYLPSLPPPHATFCRTAP
jgi:hypothetical protein